MYFKGEKASVEGISVKAVDIDRGRRLIHRVLPLSRIGKDAWEDCTLDEIREINLFANRVAALVTTRPRGRHNPYRPCKEVLRSDQKTGHYSYVDSPVFCMFTWCLRVLECVFSYLGSIGDGWLLGLSNNREESTTRASIRHPHCIYDNRIVSDIRIALEQCLSDGNRILGTTQLHLVHCLSDYCKVSDIRIALGVLFVR